MMTTTDRSQRDTKTWVRPALPVGIRWLIFLCALILMVHQTYITPLRAALEDLRWAPLFLLCGAAIVFVAFHRKLPRRIRWFDWTAIAFIGLALLSTLYSIAPALTFQRAVTLVLVYGAVFWALWTLADTSSPEIIIRALLAAGALLFGLNLLATLWPTQAFPYYGRFRGVMENPNTIGLIVALLLPLAFWAVLELKQKRWWFLIAAMLASLILSQSRLELLTTLVGTGYFLFHALPRSRLMVFVSALMLIASNVLATQLSYILTLPPQATPTPLSVAITTTPVFVTTTPGALVTTTPSAFVTTAPMATAPGVIATFAEQWQNNPRNTEFASGSGRLVAWRFGVQYLLERPWTGFGFGTENLLYDFHGVQTSLLPFNGAYFHNSYLGLATQVGLPGMLLFYAPLLALVVGEFRSGAQFPRQPLRFALCGLLVAGLVSAFFESWLYSMGNAFAFPFWTCVMLLARFQVSPPSPN